MSSVTSQESFIRAITPPSCGGDESFKNLARTGDIFINKALQSHFNKEGIKSAGELTKKMNEFHNERTMVQLGIFLEIPRYLVPIDPNYQPMNSDIKETVESLIGASLQVNGEEVVTEAVIELYRIAEKEMFLDTNYVGLLNETLQKEGIYKEPPFEDVSLGGPSHQPKWMTRLDLTYQGDEYAVESGVFTNTKDSRRYVSRQVLKQIFSLPDHVNLNQSLKMMTRAENILVRATQSLEDHEITFTKSEPGDSETQPMQATRNTSELIVDWAIRKARKNPFGMLLLLSGRISKVRGSVWYASTPEGELTLLNVKLDEESYFEIGIGESASKSRKNAAEKMIKNANLYDWLKKYYLDMLV